MRESPVRKPKKISRIQRNNSDEKTKPRDEFDFEKNANSSSMLVSACLARK